MKGILPPVFQWIHDPVCSSILESFENASRFLATAVCPSRNRALEFGRDLDISPYLSPPTVQHCQLARPSLFLLVGLQCCSNLLVYNPLLRMAAHVSDVLSKVGMSGGSVWYVVSHPFCALRS